MATPLIQNGVAYKPNPVSLEDMPVPVKSVGAKAQSPTNNIKPPSNILPTNQTAPRDLSGTYGFSNGTVYLKSPTGNQAFSKAEDFLKHSGQTSFQGLKFDETYKPTGKESIYGQPAQPPQVSTQTTPQQQQPQQQNDVIQEALRRNGIVPSSPVNLNQPYSPPNQGTTGVSQGGIIGNLLGIANNESAQVAKARQDLKQLEEGYAKQTANIEGTPMDLSLASGEQGLLNRLFAAKQGAAQTALSSALTSQGQQIQATQGAGSLNTPIVTQPGAAVLNPSSNTTTGGTASGAANLGSIIGQRGPNNQEFYNTQTGQGFSTPQELANFINQQVPGANANADNVFQVLDRLKASGGGGNIVGVNQGLIDSYANMILSGQQNQIPSSVTGNIALWNQVLQAAQAKQPGLNLNQISASVGANTGIYQSALADYASLQQNVADTKNFGDMVLQNLQGLNPSDAPILNETIQNLLANFASDPRYARLATNVQGLQARVSALLNTGEIPSAATAGAQAIANGTLPLSSMQAVVQQIEAEAGAMLTNAKTKVDAAFQNINNPGGGTPSGTGTNAGGGGNNDTTLGLF